MVRKCDRALFSRRRPPPSRPSENPVRLDTTLATDAHSARCVSSGSTRTPAVAQRYSGVAPRSPEGTFSNAWVSIGTMASATSSSRLPASDASGVFPFTFLPSVRSWNRGLVAPGTISNVCARHPVDPASTITTCRGTSCPHIMSMDASLYVAVPPTPDANDARTRRAAKIAAMTRPQTMSARYRASRLPGPAPPSPLIAPVQANGLDDEAVERSRCARLCSGVSGSVLSPGASSRPPALPLGAMLSWLRLSPIEGVRLIMRGVPARACQECDRSTRLVVFIKRLEKVRQSSEPDDGRGRGRARGMATRGAVLPREVRR